MLHPCPDIHSSFLTLWRNIRIEKVYTIILIYRFKCSPKEAPPKLQANTERGVWVCQHASALQMCAQKLMYIVWRSTCKRSCTKVPSGLTRRILWRWCSAYVCNLGVEYCTSITRNLEMEIVSGSDYISCGGMLHRSTTQWKYHARKLRLSFYVWAIVTLDWIRAKPSILHKF